MAYQPPVPGSASGSVSESSSSSGLYFFNSPFGDTTYTKVFVGGLAWETRSDTLQQYFEQFGEILEAVVISDKNTGRSKGYGFVTFRHPESASRACANPCPFIDGRRANCNLASLGRTQPARPYAPLRAPSPYIGGVPFPRGSYIGGSAYHQALPFNYQQAIAYPTFGYTTYGTEYVYPQSIYSPILPQQYVQVYGVPGAVNTSIYPYGQLTQLVSSSQNFTGIQSYSLPGHPYMQLPGPNINGITTPPRLAIQAPYAEVAVPVPAQPQFIVPAHSSQFMQGSGSDPTVS